MIIGFTGTQKGMTLDQQAGLDLILRSTKVETFIHGDCIGADAQAHTIAKRHRKWVIILPANISGKRAHCQGDITYREEAPLDRNKKIVRGCHLLVAAPSSLKETLRSGTWSTVRYARQAGIPVIILDPAVPYSHELEGGDTTDIYLGDGSPDALEEEFALAKEDTQASTCRGGQ